MARIRSERWIGRKLPHGCVDLVILIRRKVESEIFNRTPRRGDAEMKYLLLIYQDEKQLAELSESERQKLYVEDGQVKADLAAEGQAVGGGPTLPRADA